MNSETFEIVYDGPALAEHQMDVRDLAPALHGLGVLIRSANASLNSDRAAVRVLINSEHKRGCFSISVDVLQDIMGAAKSLLGSEGVKSAKDILEWMQILGIMGTGGLFAYFKWKNGRKTESIQSITDNGGSGSVQVNVEGDGNTVYIIPREVYQLSTDPNIAKATKEILQPLKKPGIESLITKDEGVEKLRIVRQDVPSIERSCESVLTQEVILSQHIILAHLKPYDAEFNPEAKTWGFWYGANHITVDITSTAIAKDAVERRQVSMDDIYKVDLEIIQRRLPSGIHRVDYKIVNPYERYSGPTQNDLFDDVNPAA